MYKQLWTSQVCATVTKPKLRACSLPCRDCTHLSKSLTLGQNAPNTSFCSFASLGVVASAISQHSRLGRLCAPWPVSAHHSFFWPATSHCKCAASPCSGGDGIFSFACCECERRSRCRGAGLDTERRQWGRELTGWGGVRHAAPSASA